MGKLTVLLADDDDELRAVLRLALAREGFEVIEAHRGDVALEVLAAAADGARALPDVLLLDFCMPELSGLGVLRIMRRFGRMPPAILMTAFPDDSVEVFARNFGASIVLRKPFNLDEVKEAVHRVIEEDAKRRRAVT